MAVWIAPNTDHKEKIIRDYVVSGLLYPVGPGYDTRLFSRQFVDAEVREVAEIRAEWPDSTEILEAKGDITRVRFILFLQNMNDEIVRVRCCAWNDLSVPEFMNGPKEPFGELAKNWQEVMEHMITYMHPREVEKGLRHQKGVTYGSFE